MTKERAEDRSFPGNPYTTPTLENEVAKTGSRFSFFRVILISGILLLLMGVFLPGIRRGPGMRDVRNRTQCRNNLKSISVALMNYAESNGGLPPAYTVDAQGKPLHSWRTLILPHLDEGSLYQKIDLSKPWNDPANSEAFNSEVRTYRCPGADCPKNCSTYMAIVTENGCFHRTESRPFSEITDEHSQTLLVMEIPSSEAVPWMQPVDADEALLNSVRLLEKPAHRSGFNAAYADGHTTYLLHEMPADVFNALISINGNENLPVNAY